MKNDIIKIVISMNYIFSQYNDVFTLMRINVIFYDILMETNLKNNQYIL